MSTSLHGAAALGLAPAAYRDPADLEPGANWWAEYREDLCQAVRSLDAWREFVGKWYAFLDDVPGPEALSRYTASDLAAVRSAMALHQVMSVYLPDDTFRRLLLPQVFATTLAVLQYGRDSAGRHFPDWAAAFHHLAADGWILFERDGARGRLYLDPKKLAPDAKEVLCGADPGYVQRYLPRFLRADQARLLREA